MALLMENAWRASPAATAARWSHGNWGRQPHLNLISDIVASINEQPLRLIVSMAPRHGKSELLSHWTPVWYLANNPKARIGLASYAADFASTWGRKARQTVTSTPGLNITVSEDRALASDWELAQGGGMMTAGVGGPFTGRGFDLLIIDDPIKNRADANSPTIRRHTWEWWTSTARTRLEPNGSIIVVMCIAEGQRVLMGDGSWKPVQEIEPGEEVYSWDGATLSPQLVKAKVAQGSSKTVVVSTDRHSLTVTPEHPFLAKAGNYVQAKDLQPGDMVETVSTLPRHGRKTPGRALRRWRVKDVRPGPVLPTYDLSVASTENFVAEGFVVHNTRWHEDDFVGRLLEGPRDDDRDSWRRSGNTSGYLL